MFRHTQKISKTKSYKLSYKKCPIRPNIKNYLCARKKQFYASFL